MEDKSAEFAKRPEKWRIEAVIHDGSWYTVAKWAKVAKVSEEVLRQWIEDNKIVYHLIQVNDSYRVSYQAIITWYKNHPEVDITDRIIPKNYPPRLWNGQTEVEAFLQAPTRKTGTVVFSTDNTSILNRIIVALAGVGRVRYEGNAKYRVSGLSDNYIKQVIAKVLTKKELESIGIKKRKEMVRRELTDFSPVFVEEALEFYIPFARNMLKPHMSTLKIYLPDEKDLESQIITWIVAAMRKFDETKTIPFSGYLSTVLRFWPYDLPDEVLGKELSDFQRKKKLAIQKLIAKDPDVEVFSNQEISEVMGITLDKYVELNSQHEAWLAERTATTLNWSDSANEKAGVALNEGDRQGISDSVYDTKLAYSISLAALSTTIDTSDYVSGMTLLNAIDSVGPEENTSLQHLPEEFISVFHEKMKVIYKEQVMNDDKMEK